MSSEFLTKSFRYPMLGIAIAFLALYLVLAVVRIQYPFELEWMEGCSVLHVQRILAGEKLYVEPSLHFTPFIYTPLYFYLCAAVSWLLEATLFSLRLVSLVSSIACFYLIYLIVAKETNRRAGIVSAGLFAATFRLSGAWFDTARVDSFFLFLLLGAIAVIRRWRSRKSAVVAAILLSLSFMTKQIALVMVMPIGIFSRFCGPREFLCFAAIITFMIGGLTLFLDQIHDGWYTCYAFYLPQNFPGDAVLYLNFFLHDLFLPFPVASLAAVVYLVYEWRKGKTKNFVFYSLFLAGMLACSWLSRGKVQEDANVLFPAYAAICILFGMGVHKLLELIPSTLTRYRNVTMALLYIIYIVQFALMKYDPIQQLPTKADLLADKALNKTIAAVDGDVFIPNHPYLLPVAGKKPYAQSICVRDVWRGDKGATLFILFNELKSALDQHQFAAIILGAPQFSLLPLAELGLEKFYRQKSLFLPGQKVLVRVDRLAGKTPANLCDQTLAPLVSGAVARRLLLGWPSEAVKHFHKELKLAAKAMPDDFPRRNAKDDVWQVRNPLASS